MHGVEKLEIVMGRLEDDSTRTILRNLAKVFLIFYALYYIIAVILVAAFEVSWKHLGILPFDWKHFSFDVGRHLGTS